MGGRYITEGRFRERAKNSLANQRRGVWRLSGVILQGNVPKGDVINKQMTGGGGQLLGERVRWEQASVDNQ